MTALSEEPEVDPELLPEDSASHSGGPETETLYVHDYKYRNANHYYPPPREKRFFEIILEY